MARARLADEAHSGVDQWPAGGAGWLIPGKGHLGHGPDRAASWAARWFLPFSEWPAGGCSASLRSARVSIARPEGKSDRASPNSTAILKRSPPTRHPRPSHAPVAPMPAHIGRAHV